MLHFVVATLPWSTNVSDATKWIHYGVTVAGGRGQGNRLDQLNQPWGLFVTDDQTVYVADFDNHRVMEWKRDAATGRVVAGGNGAGDRADQIKCPTDVIVDDESDSLIICDTCNKRGVRWPRQNGTRGETIVGNIECRGLAMDRDRSLYVVDFDRSAVIRYRSGQTLGSVVAGGNRCGNQSDQLCFPRHAFVDRDLSLYVTGSTNLVMKWTAGAIEGTAVGASSLSQHYRPQLTSPNGIIVDQSGGVYVSDDFNGRILRLSQGGTRATVVVGENRSGNASYQIDGGGDISFDRDGNLYVVDIRNHRVQRFSVDRT